MPDRELENELKRRVQGDVRFDPYSRIFYSTDASLYQMEPVGVVIPRDVDDVVAAVTTCAQAGVAVLPRGGGTSLAGQTVNHAVVLDFSRYMNAILEVNAEERWARVQPGIVLTHLNQALRPHGLHFTPDPATANRATVGGAIGNNSCGTHSILYGKTSDHVRELRVVLADGRPAHFRPVGGHAPDGAVDLKTQQGSHAGVDFAGKKDLEGHIYRESLRLASDYREEVARRFPQIQRRVSGYNLDLVPPDGPVNLSALVVGSEGTLCTVTEAKVNLEPLPRHRALAILHFRSLQEAMEATLAVLPHRPAAIEVADRMLLDQTRSSLGFARRMTFVEGDPDALLLVEFFGDTEEEVRSKIDGLERDMAHRRLGFACVRAMTPPEQANVWAVRTAGLGLLMAVQGPAKPLPFVEDTAVAPERLPEYIRRFEQVVRGHNTTAAYYGHASVGCMHIRPLVNIRSQEGLDTLVSLASDIADLVLEFGGALSGEHGDGIVRGVWTEKMFGPTLYNAFRKLKRTFDPQGIMNPGKIVDCPPMTENLRLDPESRPLDIETVLDFSTDGGFFESVALCNGQGACRKTGGTMCPSFMVTREEEHSTRGRANALRAVLTGHLPTAELTGRRLFDALDLCLECKGCKAECPTQVDMAKLKAEFLFHYYQKNRRPLRSFLFADINRLNRLGAPLAPLVNWVLRNPLTRWKLHLFLGLHRKRALPSLARVSFPAWFRRHTPLTDGHRGPVVLFHDTYMDDNEPQIGKATVQLLEAAGFRVVLAPRQVCCGRPMISHGLLGQARDNAQANVEVLYPYARDGIPIVGCEPSCLLTLRDEYPDLVRSHESRIVAQQAFLLEEFLVSLSHQGELEAKFRPSPGKLLFHTHCHQRALVGTTPSLEALRLVPNLEVEDTNAGCCGMAGAFGYEKEHYDLSMAIAEQRLFPAIRSALDTRIAAGGVSCRQQVRQGTGRPAVHLAEVLAEALMAPGEG